MTDGLSERRMIENEVVFRRHNEGVQQSMHEVQALAQESNQDYLVRQDDTALHFYCECSDENCRKRIEMRPSTYTKIHKNRNHFTLIGGHETKRIEKVVHKERAFWVVEKYTRPPETAHSLHPTTIKNS